MATSAVKGAILVSGHRIKRGEPVYKERPRRWGPPGWYGCGTKLMAAATLPSGEDICRCLNCGVVIVVVGQEITEVRRPGRPHLHQDDRGHGEQLTLQIVM